jgi:hypothetical protein
MPALRPIKQVCGQTRIRYRLDVKQRQREGAPAILFDQATKGLGLTFGAGDEYCEIRQRLYRHDAQFSS